jgi:CBS domain-containing protein
MLAKEIMTKDVTIGSPEMTVKEAAQMMKEGDFGMLPVGQDDRLIGTITDRDIAVRAVAEGKNVDRIKVEEIMSKGVHYCFEDQDVEQIAQDFGRHQIRRLLVLNREKRLVGILSLGDLSHSNINPQIMEDTVSQISNDSEGPRNDLH